MARGPEMVVHEWFKNQMKKRIGDNFAYIKSPAGVYSSRAGISDFTCCIHGTFVGVEIKSDPSKDATVIQKNYLNTIILAGGLGYILKGKDEVAVNKIIYDASVIRLNSKLQKEFPLFYIDGIDPKGRPTI